MLWEHLRTGSRRSRSSREAAPTSSSAIPDDPPDGAAARRGAPDALVATSRTAGGGSSRPRSPRTARRTACPSPPRSQEILDRAPAARPASREWVLASQLKPGCHQTTITAAATRHRQAGQDAALDAPRPPADGGLEDARRGRHPAGGPGDPQPQGREHHGRLRPLLAGPGEARRRSPPGAGGSRRSSAAGHREPSFRFQGIASGMR